MIAIDVLHTFVLVDAEGVGTMLLTVDMDAAELEPMLDQVAGVVASRVTDPEEHALVRRAAKAVFMRLEERPGTTGAAGARLPGDRLLRVFRHLAGEGPSD